METGKGWPLDGGWRGGGLSMPSLVLIMDKELIKDLVWARASLNSRVMLACWVELALKRVWVTVRLLVMSVKLGLILLATAKAMADEILSVMSSSSRKAAAQMALAASGGILGSREAVKRILTTLE